MKYSYFLVVLLILLVSCIGKQNNSENIDSNSNGRVRQIIEIATNYATSQLKDSVVTSSKDGVTWISDKQFMYEIDPSRIFIGLIDVDSTEDAIISLASFQGQYMKIPKHLIILKSNDSLKLTKVIEKEMKILSIYNKKIVAEISSVSQDSPMGGCNLCKDTVDYQFNGTELIRINQ